jgi:hypothetical protein
MGDWPQIEDVSGNGIHGTATNMEQADVASDSPGGTFSTKSLAFGGTDESVNMSDALDFDRLEPFSVSFWIKAGSIVGAPGLTIIGKLGSSPEFAGWEIYVDNVGHVVFQFIHDVSVLDVVQVYGNTIVWRNNAWHHFVITYSGSGTAAGVLFYLDGSPLAGITNNDTLTGSTLSNGVLALGARLVDSSSYLTASLYEVSVYSDVLGAAEVTWIYNAGVPRDLLDGAAPDNLEGWWRMGDEVSWPQQQVPVTAPTTQNPDDHDQVLAGVIEPAPPVQYYRMRGVDQTCPAIQQPAYVSWTSEGSPDWLASLLSPSDLPCGSDPSTDVVDIQVAGEWQVVYE